MCTKKEDAVSNDGLKEKRKIISEIWKTITHKKIYICEFCTTIHVIYRHE